MKVGVIGLGTVGRAMSQQFSRAAEIVGFDPAVSDGYPADDLANCSFAIVCVNTPMSADGSCDTSNVEEAVHRLPLDRVLIKSTIAPGTTDRLAAETGKQICFSPEYIGETAHSPWAGDSHGVPFVIIGGDPSARIWLMDRMAPILGPDKAYMGCSALEAELIKYMENSFLATKVTFVNEFYEICRAYGADWHTVREGWLMDPRIGRSHSAVFPNDRGFGGKCLPKDVNAIVKAATEVGYRPELLAEVLASNDRLREKSSDDSI